MSESTSSFLQRWFVTTLGVLLAAGMVAVAGLPVYGPAQNIAASLIAMGPAGILTQVVHPIEILFGAGLAVLVACIFFYIGAVVSGAGAAGPLSVWSAAPPWWAQPAGSSLPWTLKT